LAEEELQEALFPPQGDCEQDDAARLIKELEDKTQALQELENQYKRLAADFENYRRRQAIEREEQNKYAGFKLLEGFLPVLDNFERALVASKKVQDVTTLQQGVELIYRQLAEFLSRSGVKPLVCVGTLFDPNLHEAVGQVQTPDHPDQTVLYELERGYMHHDRVLRYAKVQIACNPEDVKPAESADVKEDEQNG
jgi:molecular chaperone GrpE